MSLMTIFTRNILDYSLLFKTTVMRGGVGREQVVHSVPELVTDIVYWFPCTQIQFSVDFVCLRGCKSRIVYFLVFLGECLSIT